MSIFLGLKEATIQNILNAGLSIKDKYIYKVTSNGRQKEVAGILNEKTLQFYASNLPNGIEAKNYTYSAFNKLFSSNVIVKNDYSNIIRSINNTTKKYKLKFDDYTATTNKLDHNFNIQLLLDKFHTLNKKYIELPKVWNNESDIRGLHGATYFPIIDFEQNFITAQSIEYQTNFKRNKAKYISWLHSNYQYKNYVGIAHKIAPYKDICFYREHLIDLNKPTIIVEAPKTAELGSLLLPNFNWIATIGANRFQNLDTSFLNSKNTYVLPDNDKVKEWKGVADKKGFKIIAALYENTKHIEGFETFDFADLIIPYLSESSNVIDNALKVVYNAILSISINNKTNDFELDKDILSASDDLYFEINQKKISNYYLSAIPSNFTENNNAIYKWHNPKGIKLKTKNFEIYKDDFTILDAGFNIIKPISQAQFIYNLKRTFLIIKFLNSSDDYLKLFDLIISNIQVNSAYKFNRNAIDKLIKIFDKKPLEDADGYSKKRNYIYNDFTNDKIDNLEFIKQLRCARLKYKTWSNLHAIKEAVKTSLNDFKFIDKKQLSINTDRNNIYIYNLIDRFNIASIGTSNLRTAKVFLNVKNKIVPENVQTNSSYISLHHLRYKNVNVSKIASETGLLRKNIKSFLNIERDIETINLIYKEINFYINNIDLLLINKNGKYLECKSNIDHYKNYIVLNESKPIAYKQYVDPPSPIEKRKLCTWNDAFNIETPSLEIIKDDANNIFEVTKTITYVPEKINFENSVLNRDFESAIKYDNNYIVSWYLFNNKQMNDNDRELLKNDIYRTANFVKDLFYYNLPIKWNEYDFYKTRTA